MEKVQIKDTTVFIGDCLESLKNMPDESVNCVVTSPPYWGLRDYGHEGQIGLEKTPEEYVENMVRVFREVKRVLKEDGTCWLNLGDSYSRQGGRKSNQPRHWDGREKTPGSMHSTRIASDIGLKPKNLVGIPWRVAFALQADGWYLRQDIVWSKSNPMPESVKDRCTKAHEYIFLLSKSEKYWFDYKAIKEQGTGNTRGNGASFKRSNSKRGESICPNSPMPTHREDREEIEYFGSRNKRSVWSVATQPYKGAHFAVYPPKLIEPCVLAGCPKGGTILDPFGGSGTTAFVANAYGRKSVLCELNPKNLNLIRKRLGMGYLSEIDTKEPKTEQLSLFS